MFVLALAFFVNRGPYRALRYSTTGDFATVYGAARCWLHGDNPYDREPLKQQLASAGAPESVRRDQDVNPSVYLPSALVWMAAIAWMKWPAANALWCGVSLLLWAAALWRILQRTPVCRRAKWLIAAAALVFSPSYVGIYDGNPGVIAISLVTLAILDRNWLRSAMLLGVALCFKPQIAFCGACVFLLRRRWGVLFLAGMVFAALLLGGLLRHPDWWRTEQRNVALSFEPGGQSDPSPASPVAWQFLNAQTLVSYAVENRTAANLVVWLVGGVLAITFVLRAKPTESQTLAFFAALTLTLTYHRYYDAQLLLLCIPFLFELWGQRARLVFAAICFCLLALPTQSVFARRLGPRAVVPSFEQALLLRNQPAAVLALAFVFALPLRRKQEL